MTGFTVRLKPGRDSGTDRLGFAAFVGIDGGDEVRVRYTPRGRFGVLNCDVHGKHTHPTCAHELAAQAAWTLYREENDQ